jgi:hypothetical protein
VNCTITGTNPAVLTITDDDAAPTVAFSSPTYVNPETGSATITVSITGTSSNTVTVNYATSNGTATAPGDYTAATGTLQWLTGDTTDKTFPVPIIDDVLNESNETVNLTLSVPVNCTITGTNPAVLTITDDDPLNFVLDVVSISVPEGGTNTFNVSLTAQPQSAVTVNVNRISGDTSIYVQSGSSFAINPADWNVLHPVVLAAAQDPDIVNGDATIRVSDNAGVITSVNIPASEIDDDKLNFVSVSQISVPEGSTAAFDVTLNFQPPSSVTATVNRASGDTDITVQSGVTLIFTPSDWDQPHAVTLAAAEDADAVNGTATILIHDNAAGIVDRFVTADEADNEVMNFETSTNSLTVPEGGTNTFTVQLTADPLGTVNVTVDNVLGDADIQPVPDPTTKTFNSTNWGIEQTVTLFAAQDTDATNGVATIRISATGIPNKDITATEGDDDSLYFITNGTPVFVPEGGTGQFSVRLSAQPSSDLNVTVSWLSGDSDITVQSGANLVFTPVDWYDFKTITLAAAEDGDSTDGAAVIRLSAPGLTDRDVTAREQDNDTSNGAVSLVLDPSEATSGQDFSVSVQIASNNNTLGTFGFEFVFDGGVFSFEGTQVGTLTTNWSITSQTVSQNRVRIQGTGGTVIPVSSGGILVTLLMKVKCLSLTSETPKNLRIENYTGDMSDAFTPEPCTSIFTFKPCPVLGDINGDGGVTPGDAQDAFEIFLGILLPDMCQQAVSDADCNGSTTPGDAQDIFEHFLGITTLPACCADAPQTQQMSISLIQRPFGPYAVDREGIPESRTLFPLNTKGQPGTFVSIPVLVTNPSGISRFSFDMNYPYEMLDYLGVKKSPLTAEFDFVVGTYETQGLIHIEGESQFPIESSDSGSLAVVVFRVREGLPDQLPVILFDPDQDLLNAEIEQGSFIRIDPFEQHRGWVILGRARTGADGFVRIPVRVSHAFGTKAFGMEFRYSGINLDFVGIEHSDHSKNFMVLEGFAKEEGILRVGGYGMSQFQAKNPGVLFELVFHRSGGRGDVELVELFDEFRNFEMRKSNTRIE